MKICKIPFCNAIIADKSKYCVNHWYEVKKNKRKKRQSDYIKCLKDNCNNTVRLLNTKYCSKHYHLTPNIKKYRIIHRNKNKEKYNEQSRIRDRTRAKKGYYSNYNKQRAEKDVGFRLKIALRRRFYMAFKNNSKQGSSIDLLGCDIEFLKKHLESKFYDNKETGESMSWSNYGQKGWHIDHIYPFDKIDVQNLEELKKVCHYTNLQPLWAKENLSKGGR